MLTRLEGLWRDISSFHNCPSQHRVQVRQSRVRMIRLEPLGRLHEVNMGCPILVCPPSPLRRRTCPNNVCGGKSRSGARGHRPVGRVRSAGEVLGCPGCRGALGRVRATGSLVHVGGHLVFPSREECWERRWRSEYRDRGGFREGMFWVTQARRARPDYRQTDAAPCWCCKRQPETQTISAGFPRGLGRTTPYRWNLEAGSNTAVTE